MNTFDAIITNFASLKINHFKPCKDDSESLSSLIDTHLSQSEKIQFGYKMEKMLSLFILRNTKLRNIREKNMKNKKETDHLFIDDAEKIIYYAELKSNIALDTEKVIETMAKCKKIEHLLSEQYVGYNVKMFLVSLRHLDKSTIRQSVKNKYIEISEHLVGVSEYLTYLGIDHQQELSNEENYKKFINKFVTILK